MASPSFQRALVLGATGMIGAHAVRACLARGIGVRAFVRPQSEGDLLERLRPTASGSDLDITVGDLHDPSSVRRAIDGCDLVLHAAAPYPRRHFGKRRFLADARSGMRNLLAASSEAAGGRLRRLVYVSSSTAIGLSRHPGEPARESDLDRAPDDSPYFAVKFMMEDMALEAQRTGLPVVLVHPTLCVDEYDDHRTTARLLVPLAKRQLPAYLKGVLNAVATRDVGEGILLAALRGRLGERYILGGENLATREFLARCARIAGVAAPRLALPLPLAETIAWTTEALAHATGGLPLFPLSGIRMSKWSQPFSIEKARAELGYEPTSLDRAIERAYAWYRLRGWL